MRFYNPNYGKETEKQIKARKRRQNASTALIWLSILAAIAGIVCCIVFKAEWYFYLVDIVGGIVLVVVFACIGPDAIKEYEDIPIEETEDEYVERELSKLKLSPESVMTGVFQRSDDTSVLGGVAYKGIWNGIAACECGHELSLRDISFDVEDRSSVSTSDANSNQSFYETANVKIKSRCPICGKASEGCYHATLPTGSIRIKHELFSDRTETTTKSYNADYPGYVRKIYNEDLARHKADTQKYEKIVMQKTEELRRSYKYRQEAARRKMEKLLAEGWYEKPSKQSAGDQIGDPKNK